MSINLEKRLANGGRVTGSSDKGYRLTLSALPAGKYALAQVDNYMHLPRRKFPHKPPLRLQIEARVSAHDLPGTWGFGLWNDPFSLGFGGGGMARALPALPDAAWFFYGSQKNHLSLQDNQPGSGFHAKTFRSTQLNPIASLLAIPALPFLFWPAAARLIRRMARRFVKEDAILLSLDVVTWHFYELIWKKDRVVFSINQTVIMETTISPQAQLGLVIWIDNQYFRFDLEGKVRFGFLNVPMEQWLEIRSLSVTPL